MVKPVNPGSNNNPLQQLNLDDYWGQVSYLDQVILKMPIPDENVRFAALRAGDLDAIQRTPYQWLMTEKSEKMGSNVAGYSDPEIDRLLTDMAVSIDFNQRRELYRKVMEKVWTDLPELYIGAAPPSGPIRTRSRISVLTPRMCSFTLVAD